MCLEGIAAYQAAAAKKKLHGFNARVAERQAKDAEARGSENERRLRLDVRRLVGAQRVAYAGMNVAVDEGSALAVQSDSAFMGELDAIDIRNNAAMEAYGHRVAAASEKYQGKQAIRAGRWALLTGIAKFGASGGFSGGGPVGGVSPSPTASFSMPNSPTAAQQKTGASAWWNNY